MQFAVRKFWNWKEETSLFWPENSVIYSGPGLAGLFRYPFWAWAGRKTPLSFLGLAGKCCYTFWAWAGRKILLSFLGLGWLQNSVILSGPGLAGKLCYSFWAWAPRKMSLSFLDQLAGRKILFPSWACPDQKILWSFLDLALPENSEILYGLRLAGKFSDPFWAWVWPDIFL